MRCRVSWNEMGRVHSNPDELWILDLVAVVPLQLPWMYLAMTVPLIGFMVQMHQ